MPTQFVSPFKDDPPEVVRGKVEVQARALCKVADPREVLYVLRIMEDGAREMKRFMEELATKGETDLPLSKGLCRSPESMVSPRMVGYLFQAVILRGERGRAIRKEFARFFRDMDSKRGRPRRDLTKCIGIENRHRQWTSSDECFSKAAADQGVAGRCGLSERTVRNYRTERARRWRKGETLTLWQLSERMDQIFALPEVKVYRKTGGKAVGGTELPTLWEKVQEREQAEAKARKQEQAEARARKRRPE
jgi:hypothetical protein